MNLTYKLRTSEIIICIFQTLISGHIYGKESNKTIWNVFIYIGKLLEMLTSQLKPFILKRKMVNQLLHRNKFK